MSRTTYMKYGFHMGFLAREIKIITTSYLEWQPLCHMPTLHSPTMIHEPQTLCEHEDFGWQGSRLSGQVIQIVPSGNYPLTHNQDMSYNPDMKYEFQKKILDEKGRDPQDIIFKSVKYTKYHLAIHPQTRHELQTLHKLQV